MTIFNEKNKEYNLKAKMFLDEDNATSIARYDIVKYPQFDQFSERQLGFFWRPQEVDLTRDIKDFRDLSEHEKHIFTSNLKRQILLDSVQGRGPQEILAPISTLPEIENWCMTWGFSETIHSRSYTHIIRNVYSNPSIVFDDMLNIKEIVDCAKDVSKYYDELEMWNFSRKYAMLGELPLDVIDDYRHKKALWLAINAINALEGVRFYVSFACSWAFAELKKMEGNAKIIKLIAKDESVHLSSTQKLLELLPKDDEDFIAIKEECKDEVKKMFEDVVEQEKAWAEYLFKDGSMIGLNANILKEYVEFIAGRRMKAIGIETSYDIKTNPLPWTVKWISSQSVQVAPQQAEISDYQVGGIKHDINDDTFEGFEL